MAHSRQSRPDFGLGFQVKVLVFPLRSQMAKYVAQAGRMMAASEVLIPYPVSIMPRPQTLDPQPHFT